MNIVIGAIALLLAAQSAAAITPAQHDHRQRAAEGSCCKHDRDCCDEGRPCCEHGGQGDCCQGHQQDGGHRNGAAAR